MAPYFQAYLRKREKAGITSLPMKSCISWIADSGTFPPLRGSCTSSVIERDLSGLEMFCCLSRNGIPGEDAAICEADLDRSFIAQIDIRKRHASIMEHKLMVLVGNVQLGERPQAVPSIIRLQALDLLPGVLVDDVCDRGVELARVANDHERKGGTPVGLSGKSCALMPRRASA